VDIIHRPVFYLKHSPSDTGFRLRLQVEPTQLEPTDRFDLLLLNNSNSNINSTNRAYEANTTQTTDEN
jgi:hypothetical protein